MAAATLPRALSSGSTGCDGARRSLWKMRLVRESFPGLTTWAWATPARKKKTARRDNRALGRLERGLGIIVHLLWTHCGFRGERNAQGGDLPGRSPPFPGSTIPT